MASTDLTGTEYPAYRGIKGAITATPTKIPTLGPKDILIKLTHTGLCYTDREFFRVGAPLSLGHEGAGVAVAVGSDVKSIKPGDRVGGGFHKNSCGHCKYCLNGNDILCYERTIFGEGDYDNGTFSPYYVGKETFVHKIPDGLASEHAAPLQCAGATTYNALADTVKSGYRVGVIGIGGLGHLAIQFAANMGAEVVVFSTSKDKEAEARGFGASEFVLLSEVEAISKPLDVLVVTSSKYPDWSK
jgi:D-arabinose 1-dehydrogenase-like Zn-dependent alcohol dehydrogenase